MSLVKPFLSFLASLRSRSLSVGIALTMIAALLVSAFVGGFTVTELKQEQMYKEVRNALSDKAILLANSLVNPVWNYDMVSVVTIVDAAFLDPQLVRVTISTQADHQAHFFNRELPGNRQGKLFTVRQSLVRNGELIGEVELESNSLLKEREFEEVRWIYTGIFFGQFVFALALVLIAVRIWVLRPLKRLSAFSNQLAAGNLDQPLRWCRTDELGQLAMQMEEMRKSLNLAFAEQRVILENVQAGVLFVRNETIQFANLRAEQIFGYSPGSLSGLPIARLHVSENDYQAFRALAQEKLLLPGNGYEEELCLQRADGSSFWAWLRGSELFAGEPGAGQILVVSDISQRKASEAQIHSLAFFDPLTNLPNRRLLLDRMQQTLATYLRTAGHGALLYIDLDNFKTLNDMHGHGVGDMLLQKVGERLKDCVRENDTVARLGGDEFMIMLDNLGKDFQEAGDKARVVADKIIESVNQPYLISGIDCNSSPSIGITVFTGMQREGAIDELFKQADMALYQAKAAGRNMLRFFDQEMQLQVMARASLEEDLREACRQKQFVLHYQAQVGQKGLLGAEVLLRWHHPLRGMVSPAEFIPLAEETGMILNIGNWVLETACVQLAAWASCTEMARLVLAVNVSARQLFHRDFVQQVQDILERTGANPQRLKLELTESLLVNDVENAIEKMMALKRLGIGFSLDDFGTGYSSLSYLKRLPLDQLKIDQSFIRDVLVDPNDAAIARMVIALAKSLGLSVIAEGVEQAAQQEFLASLGCHNCQGYLFSRPLPLSAFEEYFVRFARQDTN